MDNLTTKYPLKAIPMQKAAASTNQNAKCKLQCTKSLMCNLLGKIQANAFTNACTKL